MNITFFIGSLTGGGAERVTCNLSNHLQTKGHHVHILTMSDDEKTYPLIEDIERTSLITNKKNKSFLIRNIQRSFSFCKFLLFHKTDVYVVMLPVTTIMLLQMRWLTKAKVIASERVMPLIYHQKKQKLLKQLAHKADGWVFQTEEERMWYGKTVGDSAVKIIPNAINPDFIRPLFTGIRRKVIVTVGRLTEQKNHALLLKAFAVVHQQMSEYRLVIYGEGTKRHELEELIIKLGIQECVEMPGYATSIKESIKDASLFVLSSDYEGMPNALMESMALGVPCISTDCEGGGAKFLIKNGVNGLLVPKNDVDAMAKAMKRILDNPDFASSLGNNAHKICERLAPEKIYGEWELFIEKIVECD